MSSVPLEQLARWRTLGARNSQDVLKLGEPLLSSNLGEQEWAVREQVIVAALDLGRIALAEKQLKLLTSRFVDSPRVGVLYGLKLEAKGDVEGARKIYQSLLDDDECNVSAHQRLIALSLSVSTKAQSIGFLTKYLDTFHSDPTAWSLLASLYADLGMWEQSMTSLNQLMVLNAWDSSILVRAAEAAYTTGDYALALKFFLRAIEMSTDPSSGSGIGARNTPGGEKTRAWWGVKLSTRKLLGDSNSGASGVAVPPVPQLKALAELATERLLDSHSGSSVLKVVREVLST